MIPALTTSQRRWRNYAAYCSLSRIRDAARSVLPEPADDLERGTQILERVRSLATVGRFLWPIPDKGLKKRMPRITAPTLVVIGEQDRIVPASYGDEYANGIAGASVQIIAGAGHMLMIERPGEFAETVTEFLQ